MKRTKAPSNNKEQKKSERKQVGIHIDVELWRKFRAKALEQGKQAGHLVEELIRDYLDNEKK